MGTPARSEAHPAPVVVWEAQPGPQTALIACPIFEVFYGGARGGGKTDGMLGEWLSHEDMWGAAASGLMVRRTLTDLSDTIKRSKEIYPQLGARFNESTKTWTFPSGAQFIFRYLDNDADADHYQGHSYTRVYVEEVGQFPSPAPVMKLMATLRSGRGVPCAFRATGNPGGPGHQWVKARYITPAPMGWRVVTETFVNPFTGEPVTAERVFIPSRLSDNHYLGDDYVARLHLSGTATLVRAWLEGDWSIIEGAFFDEWSEGRHVIAPFQLPGSWGRFRSGDWGYDKPFSIGWWAVAGDDYAVAPGRVIPRGALVRYREWYGARSPNTGLRLTAEAVAAGIREREVDEPRDLTGRLAVEYGVLDPSAFAESGGPSIAERMWTSHKVGWRRADNARIPRAGAMGGWDQLRARLIGTARRREDTGQVDWLLGRPMLYLFSTCIDTIRTLPTMQHDKLRPEDMDTDGEDHAADEVRYACMSRPYVRQAPEAKSVKTLVVGGGNQVNLDELFEANERRRRSGNRIS